MDIALIIGGFVDTIYRNATLAEFAERDGLYIEAPAGEVFAGYAYVDGGFSPAPASDQPYVPNFVTRRQVMTGLAMIGWITEEEAEAALATGARPAAVQTVIDGLPEDQRFAARMKWTGFQSAYRDDPMVAALAAAEGKSEAEVNEFFVLCASIS